MTNYFLHNGAIDVSEYDLFCKGILELNLIHESKIDEEYFYGHSSRWGLPIINKLYSHEGDHNVIFKFLGSLTDSPNDYKSDDEINADFPYNKNAFLGILFPEVCAIDKKNQICTLESANIFRGINISQEISILNFWEKREEEYSNLIFSQSVEEQIKLLTDTNLFKRIKKALSNVNKYISGLENHTFSFSNMIHDHIVVISPESQSTLEHPTYGPMRNFKLPGNGIVQFSYHIKISDKRIYLYHKKGTNHLYVGYIGKHLPTVIYN